MDASSQKISDIKQQHTHSSIEEEVDDEYKDDEFEKESVHSAAGEVKHSLT